MKDWLKVHDFLYSALDVQLDIVVKAKTQDWPASKSVKSTNPAVK